MSLNILRAFRDAIPGDEKWLRFTNRRRSCHVWHWKGMSNSFKYLLIPKNDSNVTSRKKDEQLGAINLLKFEIVLSPFGQHMAEISTPFIWCLSECSWSKFSLSAYRRVALSRKLPSADKNLAAAARNISPIMKDHRNEEKKISDDQLIKYEEEDPSIFLSLLREKERKTTGWHLANGKSC